MKAILALVTAGLQVVLAVLTKMSRAADQKAGRDAEKVEANHAAEEQENRAQDIRLKLRAARSKRLPEQQ